MEAAIFDLLIRQRDRNAGNVFVSEAGNLKLIDNGGISSYTLNSVFLPSTSFHAKMILGNNFMKTGLIEYRNKYPAPGARLDYRCHSKGLIGKNYPSNLRECMEYVNAVPIQTLSRELGLDTEWMLITLKDSAQMLLDKGFEWTVVNTAGGRFTFQDPCCDMMLVEGNLSGASSWSCGHGWFFNSSLINPNYYNISKALVVQDPS